MATLFFGNTVSRLHSTLVHKVPSMHRYTVQYSFVQGRKDSFFEEKLAILLLHTFQGGGEVCSSLPYTPTVDRRPPSP